MTRFIGNQLVLVVVAICLSACAGISTNLVAPEPITYPVPRLPESRFVFEHYEAYSRELATRWDDHARLESIARQTRCDSYELTASQSLRASFWRPTQYWFGQRIEWFEVIDLPEYSAMQVAVSTSGNSTWDQPPTEVESITVSYSEAMQKAFERGGAEYIAAHPSCYLAVSLHANQWHFVYSLDRWQAQGEPLRLCIDGRTGEPCDFPDYLLQDP